MKLTEIADEELFGTEYVIVGANNSAEMKELLRRLKQVNYIPNSCDDPKHHYLHIDNSKKEFTTSYYYQVLRNSANQVAFVNVDQDITMSYMNYLLQKEY